MRDHRSQRRRSGAFITLCLLLTLAVPLAAAPPTLALEAGPTPTSLTVLAEGATVSATAIAADGRQLVTGILDSGDNVFEPAGAAVHLTGSSPYFGFLASLDASGALEWVKRLPVGGYSTRVALAVDGTGNAVVTSRFRYTVSVAPGIDLTATGAHDALVAMFDPSGGVVWARSVQSSTGPAGSWFESDNLAFDEGGVVMVGRFKDTVTVDAAPSPLSRASAGGWDIVAAAFGSDGTPRWLAGIGGTGDDSHTTLATNPAGGTTLFATVNAGGGATGTQLTSTATGTATSLSDLRLWSVDLPASGVPGTTLALGSMTSSSASLFPTAAHRGADGSIVLGVARNSFYGGWLGATGTPVLMANGGALVRFTAAGEVVWNVALPGDQNGSAEGFHSVLPTGSDFVFAAFSDEPGKVASPFGYDAAHATTLGGPDMPVLEDDRIIIGRVSGAGQVLWTNAALLGPPPDGVDSVYLPRLGVLPSGNLTVAGSTVLDTFTMGDPPDDQSVSFTGGVRGSFLARLPSTGVPRTLPACSRVAYVDPTTSALHVIDGGAPPITAAATATLGTAPAWSADAAQIAFVAGTSGSYEVRVAPADGSAAPATVGTVTTATPSITRLQFSPSGAWLSWQHPYGTLNVAPTDGSSPAWSVPVNGLPASSIAWSHDDRIAWTAADGLHVAAADGTNGLVLAPPGAQAALWSPDDQTLYTYSAASLWSVPSDGSSAPAQIVMQYPATIHDALLAPGGTGFVLVVSTSSWDFGIVAVGLDGHLYPNPFLWPVPAPSAFQGAVWPAIWRLQNGDIGYQLISSSIIVAPNFLSSAWHRQVELGAVHGPALDLVSHVSEYATTNYSDFGPQPSVGTVAARPTSFSLDGSLFFRDDFLHQSKDGIPLLDLTAGSTLPVFAPETADLAISITPPAAPIVEGATGSATVTVTNTNTGNCGTASASVDLGLGPHLSIGGSTASQGSLSGTQWQVGDLAPGASAQITVQLAAANVPATPSTSNLSADVWSNNDPDASDDQAEADVTVVPVTGIRGVVTDGSTGQPIVGIRVGLYSASATGLLATATTDAQGSYRFEPLAPGAYRIKFTDLTGGHVTEWHHDATVYASATNVTVVADNRAIADEALTPVGIHGLVTDQTTGLPIAGAQVGLYSANAPGRLDTAVTGADGTYRFEPLAPGTYRLKLWDPAGTHVTEWYHDATVYASATNVTVTASGSTTADEALVGAGRITGRVRDRTTTQPLPGVTVTLYNAAGGLVAVDVTSAAGWYDFPALPAGTYKLKLAAPGYFSEWYQDQWLAALATPLTVTAGQTLTLDGYPAVAYLTSTATPELAGTLTETGTGTPLAGAVVRVYTATGQVASTAAAADGTWTFGGLAKWTAYSLRFEHPSHTAEWWDDAPTFATATAITYDGVHPHLTLDAALAP